MSSASYVTGNSGADFGNTYYNDHHFHYGYHILAAALLGHLDPAWIDQNREYVNTLVRDIANPSKEDTYFPQWRNFDWYHGHSWAHGLYAAADGKVWALHVHKVTKLIEKGPRIKLGGHDARVRAQDVGESEREQRPGGEVSLDPDLVKHSLSNAYQRKPAIVHHRAQPAALLPLPGRQHDSAFGVHREQGRGDRV